MLYYLRYSTEASPDAKSPAIPGPRAASLGPTILVVGAGLATLGPELTGLAAPGLAVVLYLK